jgi:hypothetical protein
MEDSGGPHRVTQRRLAESEPAPAHSGESVAVPANSAAPVPRTTVDASDTELRRRQREWRRERARFELSVERGSREPADLESAE